MAHHSIERCYVCGRIGYKIKGLGDHWNNYGCNGCYRFDNDAMVSIYVPEYHCNEMFCHNHEKGECTIPDHSIGIEKLILLRKRSCVFHNILSLLPTVRFEVYDQLYDKYKDNHDYLNLLPFKQTFLILEKFKERSRDCVEEIVYEQLKINFPKFTHKNEIVDVDVYMKDYRIEEEIEYKTNMIPSINEIMAMRELIQAELEPLLQRRRRIFTSLLDEPYDFNSELSENRNTIEQVPTRQQDSQFFYVEMQSESEEEQSQSFIRNSDVYSIHSENSDNSDVIITNINVNDTITENQNNSDTISRPE